MPLYRLAHLSPEQMMAIERLESELGVTLIAYEPAPDAVRNPGELGAEDAGAIHDAILDTYRIHDDS